MIIATDRHILVLPMHGGGAITTDRTMAVSRQVARAVSALVARGQRDGSVGPDATARDVVLFGAMLAQPHAPVPNWSTASRRLKVIYLRGLRT